VTPLLELAMIRLKDGEIELAEDAIDAAERDGEPPALVEQLRGRIQMRQRRWLDAFDRFQKSLAMEPDDFNTHLLLGMAAYELGHFNLAAEHYNECILRQPGWGKPWLKLGASHAMMERHADALACFERALRLTPDDPEVHQSYAMMLYCLGDNQGALHHYRKCQELEKDNVFGVMGEAATLLRLGQWELGWDRFEARWHLPTPVAPWWYRGQPLYTGTISGLRGKRVLLRSEQGYGDSIHFARYVPLLREVAAHVIIETMGELKPLFDLAFPYAEIFVAPKMEEQVRPLHDSQLPPYDEQTSLMSLPLLFGTTPDTIPPPVHFPIRQFKWKGQTGICWAGGPRRDEPMANAVDRRRSMTREQIQPIWDACGRNVVSLQQDDLQSRHWLDTANTVSMLDLVITVDTAMAHLAGSLGIETWLMNRFDACWRWFPQADTTPWYPSMRIFNQRWLGDWDGVIRNVVKELRAREKASAN